jgi:hypothetical protein
MRAQTIQKTISTVCGKTISFLQTPGEVAKAHSTQGPAIVYPESEGISPEYYLNGVKMTKTQWREALSQYKAIIVADPIILD